MNKSKKTSIIIGIVVLIFIIILATALIANTNDSNDSDDDSETTSQTENSSDASTTTDSSDASEAEEKELESSDLVGTYTGTSRVLTLALAFPVTDLTYNLDSSFILNASGLDLAILNSQKLKVNDTFPKVRVAIAGTMLVQADGTAQIEVTDIKPEFLIDQNGQQTVVPDAQAEPLFQALTNFGINIPTATPEEPVSVVVDVTVREGGGLSLTSQAKSDIFVQFEGQK